MKKLKMDDALFWTVAAVLTTCAAFWVKTAIEFWNWVLP